MCDIYINVCLFFVPQFRYLGFASVTWVWAVQVQLIKVLSLPQPCLVKPRLIAGHISRLESNS